MAAREAAAMPLPSEDTTPPVTKTRGVAELGGFMSAAGRWKATVYRVAVIAATPATQAIDFPGKKNAPEVRGAECGAGGRA
jgi:hypothetical protein